MPLKDLLLETKDGDWGQSDPAEGLVPYHVIRATDFASASLGDVQSVPLRFLPSHTVQRRTIQLNDVLIETAGGSPGRPTGRTMLITQRVIDSFEGPITCASFARFLRADSEQIDPRYLFWFLQALYQSGEIEQYQVQHTGVARFQYTQFAATKQVPLPAMHVQQAIAEVLGALDDKVAANTKLATTAGALAGLIYDRSAARFDARPMSEVLSPILGGTPARSRVDFWAGDQLWASAKDITGAQFGVVLSTDEKITEAAVAATKAKPLPAGSVILTARGTVGAVARLAAPASFNQSCYGFVPGDIPPGVLYFAITRAVLRAKEIAHGSVFDTITMKTFDHLPFPDFHAEALTATEGEVGPLLEAVAGVVRENSSLVATRDALLPQLMSGNLGVKDAERALENAGV